MDEETVNFGGIEYTVIKTPCTCPCHSSNGSVKHVMACCKNGYNEHYVRKEDGGGLIIKLNGKKQ
jgi:hypothetical protein